MKQYASSEFLNYGNSLEKGGEQSKWFDNTSKYQSENMVKFSDKQSMKIKLESTASCWFTLSLKLW